MDKAYITRLLQRYFTNEATHEERESLFAELEKYRNNEDWVDIHTELLSQAEEIKDYNPERYQSIIDSILADRPHGVSQRGPRVIRMWKWIAAAAIIIVIATVAVFSLQTKDHKNPPTAIAHDVPPPKETRAVITLANGTKVYLDSVNSGTIAKESNVNVVKDEKGEVVYNANKAVTLSGVETLTYNTLFNPRGSKPISLTLSDGTKVWLNSESSLKYPIAFNSNTREVEITGEAYFEVAHVTTPALKGTPASGGHKVPFKVHLPNGSIVEDIGTSFNINAYPDEDATKTTLIEGSVKISASSAKNSAPSAFIKPGEQAVLNQANPLILPIKVQTVDVDEVLAWKNGAFSFSDASIENIMKEVSRYYDAQIIYQDAIPGHFVADISRDVPVSKLLQILELTNRVHFRIEGKKITVTK